MRNFDLTPLYRSTVGFDRLAHLLDNVAANGETGQTSYPPYNIEKTGENTYRISIAVAGFAESDLSIETRDGALVVSGRRSETEGERSFLHRGIATRAFERRFQLADHVRATEARSENGLLHIDLVREIPEALKPRRIEIASGPVVNNEAPQLQN
ncbi:Hsp20 family protein (plasmid) [Paroceanicella profunda]|uniref:Hsp20 family protein n=1 Tax=Paroceanicella profunda TaxID=2579971 RepID=A0A5B8FJD4_9RHOB|nr:Hsp20 family protein [Paroceanicella profunda]QDL94178.1 Hsp20 family protein [Paroceanicella profunda]